MKTLTEFSGSVLRLAANALAEAKAALPKEAPPAEVPASGAPEVPAAEGDAAKAAAPEVPAAEGDAAKAALDAAVSAATGISGDRLARLREALEAVGDKVADVRLVRVYAGEEPLAGSKKIGAHQFVVDLMPQSMKQVSSRPEKSRGGGRGDRDRGPKRDPNNPLSGGFSMDSLKEDRKNQGRGPGGAPRGPGGAPRAGGGPRGPKPA